MATPNPLGLNESQKGSYQLETDGTTSQQIRVLNVTSEFLTSDTQTLNANNTTAHVPIFGITGTVEITAIWGQVTTTLGANNTAAYWCLNDQTAQANITLNTGTTLSAAGAGSIIAKKGLAGAALTLLSNAAGVVSEPTTLETVYFSPFVAVQKTGATTNIEFNYTTTNTPTSGVITFYVRWKKISSDAAITAL